MIEKLQERFTFGKNSTDNFKYTGIRINQTADNIIEIDQKEFVDKIDDIKDIRNGAPDEPLNKIENKQLRKAIGQLSWAQMGTRPDLSFCTLELSTKMNKGTLSVIDIYIPYHVISPPSK